MTCPAKRTALLVCVWLIAGSALACKLPVFRYALERWSVDRYRIVAIVDDRENQSERRALAELESLATSGANVDVQVIDLSALSEEDVWQIEGFDGELETPLLQVFFPERNGQRRKCWEGELNSEAIGTWLDSPLRQQIAHDIASGVSAVWLLVDGPDENENQRIAELARSALATATSEIKIAEGVIPREIATEYLREHPEASIDDVLRSDIPLRVDFQLLRLTRDNANEFALRAMIAGLAVESDQALLVPIFGRGRMIDAIAADSVEEKTILNACRYLVGECSCTVKALNPGVDMLLSADWPEQLGQGALIISQPTEPTLVAIPFGAETPGTATRETIGDRPEHSFTAVATVLVVLAGICVFAVVRKGHIRL